MTRKKKVLGVFNGSFETYTGYFELDDEEQKKKAIGVFNDSFLSNFVGEGHSFFNFCLGGFLKKLGNSALHVTTNYYSKHTFKELSLQKIITRLWLC